MGKLFSRFRIVSRILRKETAFCILLYMVTQIYSPISGRMHAYDETGVCFDVRLFARSTINFTITVALRSCRHKR
jgi:hypothetical protein